MWVSHGGQSAYLQLAQRAIVEEKIFNTFKIQAPWVRAVGLGDGHHAEQCYRKILQNPEVFKNLETFKRNDSIGTPQMVRLCDGRYGFDTLRFAESACYLLERFKDLKNVIEFGANYGGLCFTVLTQFPSIERYHCIDFPEIQQLQSKYLRAVDVDTSKVSYQEPDGRFIFVSEYALTEQTDWQEIAERYFPNADGIFIRCNMDHATSEYDFLNYCRRYFSVEVTPEAKTRIPNKIVVGHKQ